MKKNTIFLFILFLANVIFGQEKYLDNFYSDELQLFGISRKEQSMDEELSEKRKAPEYFKNGYNQRRNPGYSLDYWDKKVGEFSIVYNPSQVKFPTQFGFSTSLWDYYPKLDKSYALKFHLKVENAEDLSTEWQIQLIDNAGVVAQGQLNGVNVQGEWSEIALPLKSLELSDNFNFEAIQLVLIESPKFNKKSVVKFDFVRWENSQSEVIGLTDKTIAQWIEDQKATKERRIELGFEAAAKKAHRVTVSAFAMMYLNKDLAQANQILRDFIKEDKLDSWDLYGTPAYIRFYYWFSSRVGKFPGRLEPETEKILLEHIWDRTKDKNDIHWAKNSSTWWLDGSENHDMNAKVCNLVSSRIFMNEPDFKDRVYPNYGFGGGYKYGGTGYYGKGVDPKSRHDGGRANLSDGKKYTAKDHYEAWLRFMKEYFRERARYGFFVEECSPTYSKHVMNMVDIVHTYSGDEELHKIVDNFVTLYYADWIQTSSSGLTGGPTKRQTNVGGYDSNRGLISFHLGGIANAGIWNYWNNISGYEMPEVLQKMALDRSGMGKFVYMSRGIGESEERPFPKGTERSLVCKQQSRFLKYTYVTPHYSLGVQMDHPMAIQSHLSKWGFQGLIVAEDPGARILPVAYPLEKVGRTKPVRGTDYTYRLLDPYKNLQHENTLIFQASKNWLSLSPDWFPLEQIRADRGVFIGNSWDERLEQNGWIFVRKNGVFAAVRVVEDDEEYEEERRKGAIGTQKQFNITSNGQTMKLLEKPYEWINDRFIKLKERFSPVILHTSDNDEYSSFQDFIRAVEEAPLEVYKTVVPGHFILVFTPPGDDQPELVFNHATNEIPTVNGDPINYKHPHTYDSPFIKSNYGEGVIKIEYEGLSHVLNFEKN